MRVLKGIKSYIHHILNQLLIKINNLYISLFQLHASGVHILLADVDVMLWHDLD